MRRGDLMQGVEGEWMELVLGGACGVGVGGSWVVGGGVEGVAPVNGPQ